MGQKNDKFKLSRDEIATIKARVSFSEQEIQDWYNEFKKSARFEKGKEFLTEDEFKTVYSNVYPGDVSDFARHIFRTFDTDKNGKVDFREFLIGLSVSGSDDFDRSLKWAFDVYDVSQNGAISKPEMAEIVKSVYKMLDPKRVRIPDEYSTPELVVERMFNKMDKNHDQNLTWDEFREGVRSDAFLFNLLQCSPPATDEPTDSVFR